MADGVVKQFVIRKGMESAVRAVYNLAL